MAWTDVCVKIVLIHHPEGIQACAILPKPHVLSRHVLLLSFIDSYQHFLISAKQSTKQRDAFIGVLLTSVQQLEEVRHSWEVHIHTQ